MERLQENYRRFNFNRFVYQFEGRGPEPEQIAKGGGMDTKETEAKTTEKTEADKKPEDITSLIEEHKTEAKNLISALKKDNPGSEELANKLEENINNELNKLKTEYEQKKGDIEKRLTELHNKVNQLIDGIQWAPVIPVENVEATTSAKESTETDPNKSREALTRILFNQGKLKEMLAPILGINAGANLETFQQALGKGDFGKALDNCMKNLSEEAKNGLTKEGADYKMGEKDIAAIGKSFKETYGITEEVDTKEVEFINKLEVGYDKDTKPFSEVFGKDVATSLSMKYKIEEGSTKGTIKIGGEDGKTVADVIRLLPDNIRAKYGELFENGKPKEMKSEEREAKIKELSEMGTKEAITAARMAQVEKALLSPEGVAGLKGMKPMELIATLMQLWSVAKKAMETSDFSTLGDMMGDLSSGKNPMESMKAAENTYKQKIEGVNDPNQLADMYIDPNGTKVTEMFGEGAKYKNMMKQAIEGKMEGALNVDITKMEKEAEGGTRIFANKGGSNFEITITTDSKMKVEEVETGDFDSRIAQLQEQLNGLGATTDVNRAEKAGLRDDIAKLDAKNGKEDRNEIASDITFQGLTGANSMTERFQKVLKGETPVEPAPAQTQVAENTPPPAKDKSKKGKPKDKG